MSRKLSLKGIRRDLHPTDCMINGDDLGGVEGFQGFIAVAANVMIMIMGKETADDNEGHRLPRHLLNSIRLPPIILRRQTVYNKINHLVKIESNLTSQEDDEAIVKAVIDGTTSSYLLETRLGECKQPWRSGEKWRRG
ncbi:unnamed protein product [Brassica rapa subsp. trilocularis]